MRILACIHTFIHLLNLLHLYLYITFLRLQLRMASNSNNNGNKNIYNNRGKR